MENLSSMLSEAQRWLEAQPEPQDGSATWYGFNNFRNFIAALEADQSVSNLDRACHALGWHISDQFGTYEELLTIAQFRERVSRIAKSIQRAE